MAWVPAGVGAGDELGELVGVAAREHRHWHAEDPCGWRQRQEAWRYRR